MYPASNPISVRQPASLFPASSPRPLGATVAFHYPSALPTWNWTCSLKRTGFLLRLTALRNSVHSRERTSKQPGRARHTTIEWTHTNQTRAFDLMVIQDVGDLTNHVIHAIVIP